MRIFLSYSSVDRALAESLAATLANEGHDVFWDRSDLPGGESFDERIRESIVARIKELPVLEPTKAAATALGAASYLRAEPQHR